MGVVQLPDELERAIERQVAEGRAASPAEFLQEAVLRLIDDACAEEGEVRRVASKGMADAEAGRYTIVATTSDEQTLHDRLMTRLRDRLAVQQ